MSVTQVYSIFVEGLTSPSNTGGDWVSLFTFLERLENVGTTLLSPCRGHMARAVKIKTIRIRATEHEDEKLAAFAEKHGKSKSQVLRDYIHRLPNP